MAGIEQTAGVIGLLIGGRHEALTVKRDAAMLDRLDRHWNLVVVDHYGLDAGFEMPLRRQAGRLMAIDDLADRQHDVDILLDQGALRQSIDYSGLVPPDCRLLLGASYALLKPDFAEEPPDRATRALRRILVSLGGADPENVSGRLLAAISQALPSVQIDLVVTAVMPHVKVMRRQAASLPQVTVHANVSNIIDLMRRADLAIGAGGMTSWERCAAGLPSLVVQIADNQKDALAALCHAKAAITLGLPDAGLEARALQALRDLQAVPTRLSDMAAAGRRLCDGRGTERVLCALAGNEVSKTGRSISLRAVAAMDCEQLFHWQSIADVRRFARNPQAPAWHEHQAWFFARYWQPQRFWTIILCDDMPAGLLRFDPKPDSAAGMEVSILLDPAFHGDGIGRAALTLARSIIPGRDLWAYIMDDNKPSQAMFVSAGYKPEAGGWSVNRAHSTEVH